VGASNQANVLLVEDHADARRVMARLLGQEFNVIATATYDEALAAARASMPQLVITDISLGGELDGIDLMRAICAIKPIPGIAVSGHPVDDQARLREVGISRWFIKPIHFHQLIAAAREVLAESGTASLTSAPIPTARPADSRR